MIAQAVGTDFLWNEAMTNLAPTLPRPATRRISTAAKLAVAGPLVFLATSVVASKLQEGYNPVSNEVSDLGRSGAPYNWVITIGFAAMAVGAFALAVLVRRRWNSGASAVAVPVMLGVIAITTFIAGVARVDCSGSSASCRASEAAGEVSGHHVLHQLIGLPLFLCMALVPLFAARRFRCDAAWRDFVRPSRWVSIVVALYIVTVMAFEATPVMGLVQRVALTAMYGWMIVVAWRLSHRATAGATTE
jgi:hypothetical protein